MGMDAVEWAMKVCELGAGEILLTSMNCDGTKAGYDIELTRTIAENVSSSGHYLRWSWNTGTF